jgi:glutaredoxin
MIKVTLIRPDGCTHCVAVKETLEKMKSDYPDITIEEIDMVTPKGQEMVKKYGILSSPGILINDEFFTFGGATEEQFREKFEELKKK